ncbi:hypothetical protein O6P43_019812 [Quillaja saponaria]|uniref:Uncharacterized protein n=1 Tax=Quillaja saponaria TaxID=32244 RepID=A0AAD7PKR9_QUISA|nr:hypothetical protein O6P43_019812 [Quillaja saponaria]
MDGPTQTGRDCRMSEDKYKIRDDEEVDGRSSSSVKNSISGRIAGRERAMAPPKRGKVTKKIIGDIFGAFSSSNPPST